MKCSSTFSDGVNREETGGQERGTVVDSRTARSLRMLLIFVTKKSQNLSANILLDSAVGNDIDLALPIRLFIISNNFPWSPSQWYLFTKMLSFSLFNQTFNSFTLVFVLQV